MNAWLLAGWTMLHFLWVGALVAAAGAAVRLAVRRCGPNVRYGASLVMLTAVACAPLGIAGRLATDEELLARVSKPPALPVEGITGNRDIEATGSGVHRRSRWLAGEGGGGAFVELKERMDGDVAWSEFRRDSATVGSETPSLRWGLGAELIQRFVGALPWVWLIGAPVTFLLLAAGLVGSRRLTRAGTPLVEGPAAEACARLRGVLGVSRRVALAAVEGLAQPVLVGIVKPTILLPAAALNGWTVEELEMVLVHELAHVRRWDNLVNLAQRVIEAGLFFHPCVWLASRQVRRDREECCDAVVVEHTRQPEAYAELLVSVATSLPGAGTPRAARAVMALAGASPMAQHALVGRVRRILKLEDEPMWVSRRTVGLVLILAIMSTTAVYRAALAAPEPIEMVAGPAAETEGERAKPQAAGAEETYVVVYPIADVEAIDPREWLRITTTTKDFEIGWDERTKGMIVNAPRQVHDQISAMLEHARDAARTKTPDARTLRTQIEMCQQQLMQIDRDLADCEVMKQVALMTTHPGAHQLEAAVAAELDKDPTISTYKEQLIALQQQLQQFQAPNGNQLHDASLRQLKAQYQHTQEIMQKYRLKAEQEVRKRLKEIPNEALRAAMTEHKVRVDYLTNKKTELQGKLARLVVQLTGAATEGIQDPPGTFTTSASEDAHRIVAGDHLMILAKGLPSDRPLGGNGGGGHEVEDEGTIALGPFYGRVEVAGLTEIEAEAAVRESLFVALKNVVQEPPRVWVQNMGEPLFPIVVASERTAALNPDPSDDSTLSAPPANDESGRTTRPYRLGPGDLLSIQTMGVPADRPVGGQYYTVEGRGTVALAPFYGRVEVAGLTVREAEAAVLKAISEALKDVVKEPPRVQLTIGKKARKGNERSQAFDPWHDSEGSGTTPVPAAAPRFSEPTPADGVDVTPFRPEYVLVPVPAELDESEAKRIADELVTQGFDATAVRSGPEMKLQVLVQGLPVKPTPVWESWIVDGKRRQMVRLMGPDGKVIDRARAYQSPPIERAPEEGSEGPSSSAGSAGPTPLYDGRTFEQWRGAWRTELKVEKRMESIEALAAFARAGYGREAAEDLLDMARAYDFSVMESNPEGKLTTRITELLTVDGSGIKPSVWLPVLMERVAADPDKWRELTEHLLRRFHFHDAHLDDKARALIVQMSMDARYGPNAIYLATLWRAGDGDQDGPLLEMFRAALTGDDTTNALDVADLMGYETCDRFPEMLGLLLHDDPQVSRLARTILMGNRDDERDLSSATRALLAVLDDKEQAADHASALRALAVLGPQRQDEGGELRAELVGRLLRIVDDGDEALLPPALTAAQLMSATEMKDKISALPEDRQVIVKNAMKQMEAEREGLVDEERGARRRFGRGGGYGGPGGGTFEVGVDLMGR